MAFSTLALLAATASLVVAAPSPLTPATANVGSQCLIQYTAAATGTWTNASVILKSGPNLAMTVVTPVLEGFDATTGTEIIWTCPDVTPNSAIYFYEFNNNGADATWTTRFAIADASGDTATPTNTSSGIAYGFGKLVSGATVATASISGSVAGATSSTASGASSAALSSASSSASSSAASSTSGMVTVSSTASGSSSSSSASSASSTTSRSLASAAASSTGATSSASRIAKSGAAVFLAGAGFVLLA